jgi:alkaline phosphatase
VIGSVSGTVVAISVAIGISQLDTYLVYESPETHFMKSILAAASITMDALPDSRSESLSNSSSDPLFSDPRSYSRIGRRVFLRGGILLLSTVGVPALDAVAANVESALTVGLITDLHHADKPPAGSRYYRQTLGKFAEAAQRFAIEKPDFVVELGDLIDAADSVETELGYLETINQQFASVCDERHYVLGNHCVDTLTKAEFLGHVGQSESYYSFDQSGFHFIVLDSCFRRDGEPYQRKNFDWTDANIPTAELRWLAADLELTNDPVIVFAHQRLDVTGQHSVHNAAEVRRLLEKSDKVFAVFQGHSHQNDVQEINGIHYCTLVAMIEGSGSQNSGYAVLDIHRDGTLRLTGFRRQQNHQFA